jgi:hypothetical protein
MISERVTRELVLRQLQELSPESLAEVARFIEFIQFRAQQPLQQGVAGEHAAFGVWADYPEAADAPAFAEKLRRKVETRQDV